MSKGFQLATLAGALTMVMSGYVSAAGLPSGGNKFTGWEVTNGNIDETANSSICAPGAANPYSCSVVAEGKGFKQINVSEKADASSGTSYIMTIVTDQTAGSTGTVTAGADLAFYDVSFVKMKLTLGGAPGPEESGITAQQRISEAGGAFVSTSDINTGWASTSGVNIAISQTLKDEATSGFAGDNFESGFLYRSKNSPNGTRTGFEMSIDQVAGLGSAAGNPDERDIQAFALREKQGSMLTSPKAQADQIDLNLDGKGIYWDAYSATLDADGNVASVQSSGDIKAIWIGQQINLGTGTLGGSLGSSFGYLSFDNLEGPADMVPETGFGFSAENSQSAWQWDGAFNLVDANGVTQGTPTLPVLVTPAP